MQTTLDTFVVNICYHPILSGSCPPTPAGLVALLPVTKYCVAQVNDRYLDL